MQTFELLQRRYSETNNRYLLYLDCIMLLRMSDKEGVYSVVSQKWYEKFKNRARTNFLGLAFMELIACFV